jgi:C4-dicarboxylate-specific signal transduction histidine kinase
VSDSVHFLRDGCTDLLTLLHELKRVEATVRRGEVVTADALKAGEELEESVDLPYLAERLPEACARSLDWLERVATIVRSMKGFAYPDGREMTPTDLNRALSSTLAISRGEYKHVAEVETDFADVPLVVTSAS